MRRYADFPRFSVGLEGNSRSLKFYAADLAQPIGEWKKAWRNACAAAKVKYRWHDCRHTLITRLAENPNVSEETIRALAGQVSRKMLERYSHIRTAAKQAAIAALERASFEGDCESEPLDESGLDGPGKEGSN